MRLSESIRVLTELLSSEEYGNLKTSYKGNNIVLEADATEESLKKIDWQDHWLDDIRFSNGRVKLELPTIEWQLRHLYTLMLSNRHKQPVQVNEEYGMTVIRDADGKFLAELTIHSEGVRCSIIDLTGLRKPKSSWLSRLLRKLK